MDISISFPTSFHFVVRENLHNVLTAFCGFSLFFIFLGLFFGFYYVIIQYIQNERVTKMSKMSICWECQNSTNEAKCLFVKSKGTVPYSGSEYETKTVNEESYYSKILIVINKCPRFVADDGLEYEKMKKLNEKRVHVWGCILKCDKDMKEIDRYPSMREAAKSIGKSYTEGISSACRGKNEHWYAGYRWRRIK